MNLQNLNFVEVPSSGKHNKIFYDGHYLTYDRTNKNTGKNTIGVQKVTTR